MTTLLSGGGYEVGDEVGAAALELRGVEVVVVVSDVDGVETVVVAVGEGGEGEAGEGGFVGQAVVHAEGDGESDVCVHGYESLGELEGRV